MESAIRAFRWLQFFLQHASIVHQVIVDVQAAGCPPGQRAGGSFVPDGAFDDFERLSVPVPGQTAVADGFRDLASVRAPRGDRRPVETTRGRCPCCESHLAVCRGRVLPEPCRPIDHPDRRRREAKIGLACCQAWREFVANDFDDLLIRRKLGGQYDSLPDRVGADRSARSSCCNFGRSQVVKVVRDELRPCLATRQANLRFAPAFGLDDPSACKVPAKQRPRETRQNGSQHGHRPRRCSTDVYRPAAREQLAQVAKKPSAPQSGRHWHGQAVEIVKAPSRKQSFPQRRCSW